MKILCLPYSLPPQGLIRCPTAERPTPRIQPSSEEDHLDFQPASTCELGSLHVRLKDVAYWTPIDAADSGPAVKPCRVAQHEYSFSVVLLEFPMFIGGLEMVCTGQLRWPISAISSDTAVTQVRDSIALLRCGQPIMPAHTWLI